MSFAELIKSEELRREASYNEFEPLRIFVEDEYEQPGPTGSPVDTIYQMRLVLAQNTRFNNRTSGEEMFRRKEEMVHSIKRFLYRDMEPKLYAALKAVANGSRDEAAKALSVLIEEIRSTDDTEVMLSRIKR